MIGRAGHFVLQAPGPAAYEAFIPAPLPPQPPLEVDAPMQDLLEQAGLALGRLDGITRLLPDPDLFMYMYVRKEAVLSSQIEGTQSSLSDLLLHENAAAAGVPRSNDVEDVSNYIVAMNHGLELLKTIPLSLRLLRQIHGKLVAGARGGDKTPGEFRTTQNWIGGTRPGDARFVPPPPHEMGQALDNLEKFLHDQPARTPTLLKAGLAHAQFETIHPFLDGNGRVGRLLVTLLFVAEGVLTQPLLYVSLYFKQHRNEYYERLQRVRTHGEWERWIRFYLEGIRYVAMQATETAGNLVRLFEEDHKMIMARGKSAHSTLRVYELLKRKAVLSIPEAARALTSTPPTIGSAVGILESLGIVSEITGRQRDRQYSYKKYLDILSEGTEEPVRQ